jgi:hypothetical protein
LACAAEQSITIQNIFRNSDTRDPYNGLENIHMLCKIWDIHHQGTHTVVVFNWLTCNIRYEYLRRTKYHFESGNYLCRYTEIGVLVQNVLEFTKEILSLCNVNNLFHQVRFFHCRIFLVISIWLPAYIQVHFVKRFDLILGKRTFSIVELWICEETGI